MINSQYPISPSIDPAYLEPPHTPEPVYRNPFLIVWRGRWIIMATTLIGLLGGFLAIRRATPIFYSTSKIYVEQSGPKIIHENESGIMTQSTNYLYTQVELIRSTSVLTAALDQCDLRQMRTLAGKKNPLSYLKKNLRITVGTKNDILSVTFKGPDAVEAGEIVNSIVDAYIAFHSKKKRTNSAEILEILRQERAERGLELSQRMNALMEFKRQNELLAFESDQGNVIYKRMNHFSQALTDAQLQTLEAKFFYETAKTMSQDPEHFRQFIETQRTEGTAMPVNNRLDVLEKRLEALELARDEKLILFTSGHPDIAILDKEINLLRKQVDAQTQEMANSFLDIAKQEYLSALEKEKQLQDHFDSQRELILTLNDHISQYTVLESNYNQTRRLCETLDQRIRELNISEDVGALNISILEFARPAEHPSEPNKTKMMATSVLLGLMLGTGLSFLRNIADQRVHSADEAVDCLQAPILGSVPVMKKEKSRRKRKENIRLSVDSLAAESFRAVRTAIFFGVPRDQARMIQITSSMQGEGKSVLSSYLALSMAQSGQRILLVDGDFQKPVQHKYYDYPLDPGLSEVLAGLKEFDQVVRTDQDSGLDILTCGSVTSNSSEMLGNRAFHDLLHRLTETYDRIIVDSPPVIPMADGCVLAAVCDVTVVVIRADQSRRQALRQTHQALRAVNAHVLGAVVNRVSRNKSRFKYY